MAEKMTNIPSNRCGFELLPEEVEYSGNEKSWERRASPMCCWREVWKDHSDTDRCIWHADVVEKPVSDLIAARNDHHERLDGAILPNLSQQSDKLSLGDCTLYGAKFGNSEVIEIDFTDGKLKWAEFTGHTPLMGDFTEADLEGARFKDASVRGCVFRKADLQSADFRGAKLHWANFTKATLLEADFSDSDLRRTEFSDSFLKLTDFTNAELQYADFSEANARGAVFRHATLHDAVFTRTDCRKAIFTEALLYEVVFSDTRINSDTAFYDPSMTYPYCIYEKDSDTLDIGRDVVPLEAAQWVYRRLETLHEANALSDEARMFHISKEEAERELHKEQLRFGSWGVKTLMWWLTKHGESVGRVLCWWAFVIVTSGILFAFGDGVRDGRGNEYVLTSLQELGTTAGINDLLMNLYFSMTTFSTIMDGGLAPAGTSTRAIVAVESITGALLVALFVFVLGRQTAR